MTNNRMTPDNITRLAERVEAISTGLTEAERRVKTAGIAADLRTLAKQQSAANLVPGVMHCAKCKFRLHRVTLYMGDGTTGAGDSKTEPCPNGCGPLWPVTWEQEAREAMALANSMHEQLQTAQQQGKAGGVTEIPTGTKVSVDVSTGDEDFEHRIFATVIGVERGEKPVILCEEESRNFAPPAHSPEAGVTDALFEIVEEAFREGFASPATYNDVAENTPDESWEQKREYFRKRFRKAAALTAPQPKDAS